MVAPTWDPSGPAGYIREHYDTLVHRLRERDLTPEVHLQDARRMEALEDGSVDLVVTSPPYPYIEMWDEQLAAQAGLDPAVFEKDPGHFETCHELLDEVWAECQRVLGEGGMLCVNIGDATRSVAGQFRCFQNHARVISGCQAKGFSSLIPILWKKPTNKPNSFLGSGFLPTNGYVTLDCEHILVFRKGGKRSFAPKDPLRYASAFAKEERDRWFSQLWEVRGARQEGMAVFPDAIPYRLIRMFSTLGDVVLDPFLGSGQTLRMARLLGRKGVGFEIDQELAGVLEDRVDPSPPSPEEVLANLLAIYDEEDPRVQVGHNAVHVAPAVQGTG